MTEFYLLNNNIVDNNYGTCQMFTSSAVLIFSSKLLNIYKVILHKICYLESYGSLSRTQNNHGT